MWVAKYNGPGNGYDIGLALDTGLSGNIYVTGGSEDTNGILDYFTVAYSSSGSELWVARYEEGIIARAIIVDKFENVYIAGVGKINGIDRAITVAYNNLGNEIWVAEYGYYGNASDITLDSFGNIYVTGKTHDPLPYPDFFTIKYSQTFPDYPPVADAGPDQTVYIWETVEFDGSNSSDPDGKIVSYEWDFDDGSPFGYGINTSHIYNKTGVYNVTLTVCDDEGYTDTDSCLITVKYPPMASYYFPQKYLCQGWNLISVPAIQNKTEIEYVLQLMGGKYDALQFYNNSARIDPWKQYEVGKPFGNDLSEIYETMGFWIHITNQGDTIFLYNGTKPTENQTILLHSGWNMVGYPSLGDKKRTAALNNLIFGSDVDSVWTFDAATHSWNEIEENDGFEVGGGYWVHAKRKCVWEVPL